MSREDEAPRLRSIHETGQGEKTQTHPVSLLTPAGRLLSMLILEEGGNGGQVDVIGVIT